MDYEGVVLRLEYRRSVEGKYAVSSSGHDGTLGVGHWPGREQLWGRTEEAASIEVIHRALDCGVTTIDTADVYSKGRSEEIIGRALRGRRHEAQILTKVRSEMGAGPHDKGLSRLHIVAACEASLRCLQTDYIDLYQVHAWDPDAPLEETLRALDDLVRDGKVRYVGCSNFAAWQLTWALWIADRRGYASFVSAQPHYNMFERSVEAELLPACAQFGVGVIPYFPLASGLLTGKYHAGAPIPAGTRYHSNERLQQQLTNDRLGQVAWLEEIARAHHKTVGRLVNLRNNGGPRPISGPLGAMRGR